MSNILTLRKSMRFRIFYQDIDCDIKGMESEGK